MSLHTFQKLLYLLATLTALSAAVPTWHKFAPRDPASNYNDNKIMGVNLGGWFVMEAYITPSIFEEAGDGPVDEWTLTAQLGKDAAYSILNAHYNSFITQDDFYQIAAAGLNHVRIPIGYWSITPIDGDPYIQGALEVMDQAIVWARNAGLKVVIDLHGAPGSQNGLDHSGHKGSIEWGTGDTVAITLGTAQALAYRYSGDMDVVTSIEVLNEPLADIGIVTQYYNDAYGDVKAVSSDYVVTIHDGFLGPEYWNGYNPGDLLMVDTHLYQIFSSDLLAQSAAAFIGATCAWSPILAGTTHWDFVGEWSGAFTDCAKYLNGRYAGSRYDGTYTGSYYIGSCDGKVSGSVEALSDNDKYRIRSYIESQLDSFSARSGWMFWTWKTEGAPEFDMQALIAGGLFPQPLDNRQYPGQCG